MPFQGLSECLKPIPEGQSVSANELLQPLGPDQVLLGQQEKADRGKLSHFPMALNEAVDQNGDHPAGQAEKE